jgi:hypothetical protein
MANLPMTRGDGWQSVPERTKPSLHQLAHLVVLALTSVDTVGPAKLQYLPRPLGR